jgi:hypothetical protein
LFFGSELRTELLQGTAPYLFGDLYGIVRNSLIVGFCRITDVAGTGQRVNLTSNFIVSWDWEPAVKANLTKVNARLTSFREYVEPARSKRIAHVDLRAQMVDREPLGAFPEGADKEFFQDLEEFLTIAHQAINGGPFLLSVGGASDTYKLFSALAQARLFDQCKECDQTARDNAILDFELGI